MISSSWFFNIFRKRIWKHSWSSKKYCSKLQLRSPAQRIHQQSLAWAEVQYWIFSYKTWSKRCSTGYFSFNFLSSTSSSTQSTRGQNRQLHSTRQGPELTKMKTPGLLTKPLQHIPSPVELNLDMPTKLQVIPNMSNKCSTLCRTSCVHAPSSKH